jgi:hypothetical protein
MWALGLVLPTATGLSRYLRTSYFDSQGLSIMGRDDRQIGKYLILVDASHRPDHDQLDSLRRVPRYRVPHTSRSPH